MQTLADVSRLVRHMRRDIIEMVFAAGSGHPGGALSAVDLVGVLYARHLQHRPTEPAWPERDRFILSKGHAAAVLYAALAASGYFPREALTSYRKLGGSLQGHPSRFKTPGVEVSNGSLGQGLSVGLGMAMGLRLRHLSARVYVLLSDGECQSGQTWEAAMAAAHYRASNLTAIVDGNGLETDGLVAEVLAIEPLAAKWSAFGWDVITIDGHDLCQIDDAYQQVRNSKRPTVVLARTIKGKGVRFMEGAPEWHSGSLTRSHYETALAGLADTEDVL